MIENTRLTVRVFCRLRPAETARMAAGRNSPAPIEATSATMMGLLNPVLAVILQEAGCVSVVFSSVLLLWAKPKAGCQSVNVSNTGCCAR
ncbi:hypothetical protein M7775_23435 [Sporomusa sphaeroides DSM 2875]|uniref:hypothetical protein n=1 Tax=Sporomusa sphaeroides TaxID=47679 RepID=UPI00202FB28E|nr:hypothetical protein [Sporomusa sphaeroides]MCM0761508.1 hypothetical protein [Sporomusa sphaeroides DSM 2875]